MEIQIISDIICPWCYIGKRRLEEALQQWAPSEIIQIVWRPFQLNPDMPSEGMDRQKYRERKFGSVKQALQLDAQMVEVGKSVGIPFRFDLQRNTPNTFQAHRLVWLAVRAGMQEAVVEAFFRAYFCEGANLSQRSTLLEIAASAGLEAARCESFLQSELGSAEIQSEERQTREMNVTAVPCFVLNHRLLVAGAQLPETLIEAFNKAQVATPEC